MSRVSPPRFIVIQTFLRRPPPQNKKDPSADFFTIQKIFQNVIIFSRSLKNPFPKQYT